MRSFVTCAAMIFTASQLAAQVKPPDRPVTDPKSLESPANAAARPVGLDDIGTTHSLMDAAWSVNGRQLFVATNLSGRFNIWRMNSAGSWPVQMTRSDEAQSGLATSPDGKWLYFSQDEGGNEYPDIYRVPTGGGPAENLTNTPDRREDNMLAGPAELVALSTKRKSDGQANLALIDGNGKVRLLTDEKEPQFIWTPAAWIAGGKALVANRQSIDGTIGEVWQIDIASGAATRLLGAAKTLYMASGASPDGATLAVTTNEKTGQPHAGVYIVASKSWRWLKPTPWEQWSDVVSTDGRTMIVRTNDNGRSTLSRVDLTSMTETVLTLAPGRNSTLGSQAISPDGRQMLVGHSGADAPASLYLYDLAADSATQAIPLAMASLTSATLPKSQIVTYKSFDGTLISAIVTVPFNLKRDGANPAIVIPHGGPSSQAEDGFSRLATAFATRGYVVIQPNFRGSTGYGKAFQAANFKDLGGGDLKDTVAAKHFLVASGYVDPKKVGIFGGSYGGFMAMMAIGRTPDEFAAAVQWYGIINWRTMYRDQDALLQAYQRTLIGTPEENPAVYDASSPLTYIKAAKAPLLSIQGENDIRVPRGQAQEVANLLAAKGNVVETVFYPGEGHGFQKRENQLDSLKRTIAWFDKYLKNP